MSTWTLGGWWLKCPRLSILGGWVVKNGQNLVHVVIERPHIGIIVPLARMATLIEHISAQPIECSSKSMSTNNFLL